MKAVHAVQLSSRAKQSIVRVGTFAMLLALASTAMAGAVPHELGRAGTPPPKSAASKASPAPPLRVLVGGDDAAHAVVIPSLPYNDSGNTCGLHDDYQFPCPPDSTGSPDVVYSFTPSSNVCVNVSLCQSDYDTGLYIWQNTVGNTIQCNDDACGPTGQQSRIAGLQLTAGTTYYIVVDAYTGCGNYNLSVSQCAPSCLPLPCPPGAITENEPVCSTAYADHTNGGCNSSPPVYQNITLPTTICGQYGKFCDNFSCDHILRDTDWYQFTLTDPTTLRICVKGEATTQIDLAIASAGCNPGTIVPGSLYDAPPCENFCENVRVDPGTYWLFVAPTADNSLPACGSRYVVSISGSPPSGIEPGEVPVALTLAQNTPNPARGGRTTIGFTLPQATSVELAVYSLRGDRIRTLVSGPQSAGYKSIVWDGRDDSGRRVNSGVYFYQLVAGSFGTAKKIILLK